MALLGSLAASGVASAQANDPPCPVGLCVAAQPPQTPSVLSPPILGPIHACSSVVEVSGYVPGATIDLFLGSSISAFSSFTPTAPDSFTQDVATALSAATGASAFVASQQLRARQRIGAGPPSAFSDVVTVTTRTGPLPTPTVVAPLYQCARVVAVEGVERGMSLTIANVPSSGGSTRCCRGRRLGTTSR